MKQDARRFWVDPNGKRLIPVVGKVKWASIPVRSARADEPCAVYDCEDMNSASANS